MGTTKSYITGFALSILLTLAAYSAVVQKVFEGAMLTAVILGLAVIQLTVQVIFFLHLGQESKPRWNLIFFLSTISIILTVVIASLWIMANLNYNMTPHEMNEVLMLREGIYKEN
jgi:cytochrome o ubiquinol oxidase operon protein cyoD